MHIFIGTRKTVTSCIWCLLTDPTLQNYEIQRNSGGFTNPPINFLHST